MEGLLDSKHLDRDQALEVISAVGQMLAAIVVSDKRVDVDEHDRALAQIEGLGRLIPHSLTEGEAEWLMTSSMESALKEGKGFEDLLEPFYSCLERYGAFFSQELRKALHKAATQISSDIAQYNKGELTALFQLEKRLFTI